MSLTLIATRSMPTVSVRSSANASNQLGADTVGCPHEHGVLETACRFSTRPPKPPRPGEHLRAASCAGERLDALDQRVAGVDVDDRVAVGEGA
jgi:hypothetical protein